MTTKGTERNAYTAGHQYNNLPDVKRTKHTAINPIIKLGVINPST